MSESGPQHPNPAVQWKNRRRIAYMAFIGSSVVLVGFLLLAFFGAMPETTLSIVSEVVIWYILGSFGLTGAYMGLATWYERR